jgi:hypothetical protein
MSIMKTRNPHPTKPKVKPRRWLVEGVEEDLILVYSGGFYVAIRYKWARELVDGIHDACDRRDAALREAAK